MRYADARMMGGMMLGLCPKMCDAGIENPQKNVWLNKSINPLNKTFLLGKKAKNTFFTQEAKPKKNVFILEQMAYFFLNPNQNPNRQNCQNEP